MNGVANGLYGGDLPNQINTPWIDFSEQSTIVGWSSFTTKQIRYKVIGKIVYFNIFITGTSNSTSTTFTIPFVCNKFQGSMLPYIQDNAVFTPGFAGFVSVPSNLITAYRYSAINAITLTWTASGTKTIIGNFFLEIE